MITWAFIAASLWLAAVDGATDPPSPTEDGTLPAPTAVASEGMTDSHA